MFIRSFLSSADSDVQAISTAFGLSLCVIYELPDSFKSHCSPLTDTMAPLRFHTPARGPHTHFLTQSPAYFISHSLTHLLNHSARTHRAAIYHEAMLEEIVILGNRINPRISSSAGVLRCWTKGGGRRWKRENDEEKIRRESQRKLISETCIHLHGFHSYLSFSRFACRVRMEEGSETHPVM